jgi:SAM-dependent methyltransferase
MVRALAGRLRDRFRNARFQGIRRRFGPTIGQGWVLDLGGGPGSYFAVRFPDRARMVFLDISRREVAMVVTEMPGLRAVVADGEQLQFASASIALIVSNSVIEHVANPDRLATEIQRVGQAYFVQTPHAGFPVETHSYVGIPFYRQSRGKRMRQLLCRLFGADYSYVESVRYLSELDLRRIFPGAAIERELVLGLTKSFYVIGKQARR